MRLSVHLRNEYMLYYACMHASLFLSSAVVVFLDMDHWSDADK